MAPQWNHSLHKLYILGNLKKKMRHRISESICSGEENSAPVAPSGWTPLGPAIAAIASWVKLLLFLLASAMSVM